MTENIFLKFALKYADTGFDIFPLQPKNKIPFANFSWNLLASRDHAKITEWWTQHPDANIGLATGARSGIVVVDIDLKSNGEETIANLIETYGELPLTPQCRTGGGGRHIFFQHPGFEIRNSAGKLGDGIDIRGDGGYVVAAPSIHETGNKYQWIDGYLLSKTPLAELPEWIISLLQADKSKPVKSVSENTVSGDNNPATKIISSQRNTTLISLAGTMRKRGMSSEAIYLALIAENNTRCVPPLGDDEIKRISDSIERYDKPEAQPVRANRLEVEWLLAAAAYQSPATAQREAGYITANQFSDRTLAKFWQDMRSGVSNVQAATEAGIIKDLINFQSKINIYDMSSYAAQLARNEYIENIWFRQGDMENAIKAGDATLLKKIIDEIAADMPFSSREAMDGEGLHNNFLNLLNNLDGRSVKTGIPSFDRATGGLERQTYSILAARPSMGKSTLAWQIARRVAEGGGKVVFFSLEMAASQLWAKAACGELGWRWKEVRENMTPEYKDILITLSEKLNKRLAKNIILDDSPATSEIIWQQTARYKPDLVIIDHLRLVSDRNENEVKRLGEITQKNKDLAKAYNCHVMTLAQLNRGTDNRDQKRPQLTDLRDSGQIEENADTVFMLYREEYYQDTEPTRYSTTEIWIRKFRDDVRNQCIKLDFDSQFQAFIEPQDRI
jgi:KaiC/GvpD/RAD55 family RecA-like ATPase